MEITVPAAMLPTTAEAQPFLESVRAAQDLAGMLAALEVAAGTPGLGREGGVRLLATSLSPVPDDVFHYFAATAPGELARNPALTQLQMRRLAFRGLDILGAPGSHAEADVRAAAGALSHLLAGGRIGDDFRGRLRGRVHAASSPEARAWACAVLLRDPRLPAAELLSVAKVATDLRMCPAFHGPEGSLPLLVLGHPSASGRVIAAFADEAGFTGLFCHTVIRNLLATAPPWGLRTDSTLRRIAWRVLLAAAIRLARAGRWYRLPWTYAHASTPAFWETPLDGRAAHAPPVA